MRGLAEEITPQGPVTRDGIVAEVVADSPLVSNPCALAFDARGRLFVGMGPQYRKPTPETPGDAVHLLIDDDGDGRFDRRSRFAEGFNCIQSIAWSGTDLWVANSPDLTVVRDLDGDDVADEYVRVFTDLGNLEHGLHGLEWGPDGRLYMSKGNSKGLTQPPDRIAPRAFRDLWDTQAPEGTPDHPEPVVFTASSYRRNFHDPDDDWGRSGGFLRCRDLGRDLEIVARGMRNPWSIACDDDFNWLGTDNDQTLGDKFIAPFFGADFGWGHGWSYDWEGVGHPPTVPASGPLFEGSGTGVVFYSDGALGPDLDGVFLVNDWLRRLTLIYRPVWDGALMVPDGGEPGILASAGGGRSMQGSSGRLFDPTDIKVGPDGSVFVASWGREYGVVWNDGDQANAGRIYRLRHRDHRPADPSSRLLAELDGTSSIKDLVGALGSPLPARRVVAQRELLVRGGDAVDELAAAVRDARPEGRRIRTWALWTLLQIEDAAAPRAEGAGPLGRLVDEGAGPAAGSDVAWRVQCLRVSAARAIRDGRPLVGVFVRALHDAEPRVRHAALVAVREARDPSLRDTLLETIANEDDAVGRFAAWGALSATADRALLESLTSHRSAAVRLAALLALANRGEATVPVVRPLHRDADPEVARWAARWLDAMGAEDGPLIVVDPPGGTFGGPVDVALSSRVKGGEIRYTLDGSSPGDTSPRYRGPIRIGATSTLRAVVVRDRVPIGPVYEELFVVAADGAEPAVEKASLAPVAGIRIPRGVVVRWVPGGLQEGEPAYVDRDYRIRSVPGWLEGAGVIRCANEDAGSGGADWMRFELLCAADVILAHDVRMAGLPSWTRDGGWEATDEWIVTDEARFRVHRRAFEAGDVVIGGNTDDGTDRGKSNYLLAVIPRMIQPPERATTLDAVLAVLDRGHAARGRLLYLSDHGAGCFRCHRMEDRGSLLAPDLAGIGSRADRAFIARSIVEPGADITEGFALHVCRTHDGRALAGVIVEETAAALTLAQADGSLVEVPTREIASRESTADSGMPAVFAAMLSPLQVADLVAYLAEAGGDDETGAPAGRMPEGADAGGEATVPEGALSIRDGGDGVFHLVGGRQRLATYLPGHPSMPRPGWVNVRTPTGIPVTREFPVTRENSGGGDDHAWMHPGIWISFGWIDGEDFWRLRARVETTGVIEAPWARNGEAGFGIENRWISGDGARTVLIERATYRFRSDPDGVMMVCDHRFRAPEGRGFAFGDQEEGGLGIRVAPDLRVQGGGGRILADHGGRNGDGTWGREFGWLDYAGTSNHRFVGLLVVPDRGNPRRSWAHSRDYGVAVANPFPRQPDGRREPYVTTPVPAGGEYRLRFGVLIHDAPAEAAFRPAEAASRVETVLEAAR